MPHRRAVPATDGQATDLSSHLTVAIMLSGVAGLVNQIAWTRLLRLALGSTTEAVTTVLAAFMAGLAIGSLIGGRLADRRDRHEALRLYGRIEIGIAILALGSAALLDRLPTILTAIERVMGAGAILRVAAAGLVLLPPTILMGATLPVIARAIADRGQRLSRDVAWLYAINTSGGVVGAAIAGFVLLPLVGIRLTIVGAAILNAIAAWLVLRLAHATHAGSLPQPNGEPIATSENAVLPTSARRLALLSAAISGAVALGFEVLWTRTIVLTVGSTSAAFSLMLVTFLTGIAAGSALYERMGRRSCADARLAAVLQVGIALSSILLLRLANGLPWLYLWLWQSVPEGRIGLVLVRLVPCVVLMILPTLLMGANLPAIVQAVARREGAIGRDVGTVYAYNTAGAIVGPIVVGLFAMRWLGVATAATAVAAAGLVGAVAAIASAHLAGARGTGRLALALVAAAVVVAFTPPWDPRVMGRGLAYVADRLDKVEVEGKLEEAIANVQVVHYRDGNESSVLVYDSGFLRSFAVNGRHEATSSPNDMRNQYLLGHLPAILHRGPVRQGLVIALGSGMTAGCLARHADRVTVVEIEREVVGAAAAFREWNHGVIGNSRVDVVIDDGRRFLLRDTTLYDVITVDPIHPAVAGSEALYSREQYELVRSRLAPGGVAAQWLPLYQMGTEQARSICRTFQEVMPDAQLWVNGGDAILIGGAGETLRPLAEIRDEIARPEIAESLARVGQHRLGTFVAGYVLGPAQIRRYVEGARVSTDDHPVLEFSLPWQIYRDTVDRNLLEIFRHASRDAPGSAVGLAPEELAAVESASSAVLFDQIALALRSVGHIETSREFFARAYDLNPDDPLAKQALGR